MCSSDLGLSVMAIAVVAHAVWSMASRLCRGIPLISVALVAMMLAWANPSTAGQIGVLLLAGFAGMLTVRPTPAAVHERLDLPLGRREGTGWICALGLVFVGLMAADTLGGSATTSVFLAFFRTGSVVFGGGHVVLPVLHAAVVSKGWINEDVLMAGYSAAQAIPGPLFTFAGFLGAAMHAPVSGWSGGSLCVAAIFAPSFMLVFGALPYWEGLRQCRRAQAALAAVNAATVGILAATFQRALVATSLHSLMDITLAAAALTAIEIGRAHV